MSAMTPSSAVLAPSLYIHVPFCERICSYCVFSKTARLSLIDAWLDAIETEWKTRFEPLAKAGLFSDHETGCTNMNQSPEQTGSFFQTVYIGGGTPSVLSLEQIRRLLALVAPFTSPQTEWTIEVNPESVTKEKAELYASFGINRVSIGLQTFNEERLKTLGRFHTARQAREAVSILKAAGIDNLCADLMYGFPNETLEELNADLDAFLDLDIDHLSIYSLILEEGTSLARLVRQEDLDEELNAQMYETIHKRMTEQGYVHYEVSSFAKNEKYGQHNLFIWQDGRYDALGFGACGRDEHGLYEHASSLQAYLENPCELIYEEHPDPAFDALMTGLRTVFGISISDWEAKYHSDFKTVYSSVLAKWADRLVLQGDRLSVTAQGMECLDSILVDFLDAKW